MTGYSYGSGTDDDYATIKYDGSGTELWVARYDGPGNLYDRGFSIAIGSSEDVYVTGHSVGLGTNLDYATIKYDASSGTELWVARYNGLGNYNDEAYALAVDGPGNVYVTGYSTNGGTSSDYTTIKYQQEITSVGLEEGEVPRESSLLQNYPNPFNPSTTIEFALPQRIFVTLKVFNLLGQEVATLVSEELNAGVHRRQWNAADLAGGVYFCRLEADHVIETRKLLLLK